MPDLTLDDARAMLDRAISHARELDVRVAVAIVDASGHLVTSARMDGAAFMTPDLATGKAWTSAAFRAPSGAVAENMHPAPAFAASIAASMPGRFMPRQGALPLDAGGAVGVSGATSSQDEEIARRAIGD